MYNCAFNGDRPYGRRVKAALGIAINQRRQLVHAAHPQIAPLAQFAAVVARQSLHCALPENVRELAAVARRVALLVFVVRHRSDLRFHVLSP